MYSDSYKILSIRELTEYLKDNSRQWTDFDEQLKTNLCYIYYLKSGEVILLPNDMSDNSQGILFNSKETYRDYLLKDKFPIENPEMSIYEKCQPEILGIKENIEEVLRYLDSLINNDSITDMSTTNELSGLLQKLREKKKGISLKDKLYIALALGEYLRRANKGDWILLKYYGKYNPYYVPGILYSNNNQVLLILNYFDSYFDNKSLSIEAYTKLQYIREPGLTLESLKYSKYPNSYKRL